MDINPLSTIPQPEIKEEYLKFGDRLLNRLTAKKSDPQKIDLKEFLRECTYLALKCGFDEIRPYSLPTKPDVLFDYEHLEKVEQAKIRKKIFEEDRVKEYLKQKWGIKLQNKSNKIWLKELLGRLEEYGDPVNTARVRQRLYEFEDR